MIKPKKSLGQNFLIDNSISRRIVDALSPRADDLVIEIGPGLGALTQLLVERAGFVVAIEIDSRLTKELRARVSAANLSIIESDVLEVNWMELIESSTRSWQQASGLEDQRPRVRVVANLPYYISTPIVERLINQVAPIRDMTLMLQKEVVDRITSEPGGRDYGYLSVLVQYHTRAVKLFDVPPNAFKPAPKVWSSIVRLSKRSEPAVAIVDEGRFFAVVRAAFSQRRKTIANNLKAARGALGFGSEVSDALDRAGISPGRRAETLSLAEFAALDRALFGQ